MISPIESNNIMDHSYISHRVAFVETSHQTRIEAQNKNHLPAQSSHQLSLSPSPKWALSIIG